MPAERHRPARGGLLLALLIGAAPAAPAVGAGLGVGEYRSAERTVDSSLAPRELSTVAFEQRSASHCVAFGSSVAEAPSAGLENDYQLGFLDTDVGGEDFDVRQWLDFADDPGTNDPFYRLVSAVHVDDGVPRGEHTIVWAGMKSPGHEDLEVPASNLAVVCAKAEIPWRDEGVLRGRVRAAVGGTTGVDAQVTSAAAEELLALRFTLAKPRHCVALASAVAFNPGGGGVDNAYELLLAAAGDVAGSPEQHIELDDNAGAQDTEFLPVTAVRFLPALAAGPQEIRWLGRKEAAGDASLTLGYPTLALACAKDQLGPRPVSGRAAVGGVSLAGGVAINDDAVHELVSLRFELKRPARCVAFASAWARNPGGGTLDNVYRFDLRLDGTGFNLPYRLEFDDNEGYDDAGVLPVALTGGWPVSKGENRVSLVVKKGDAGDADTTVSSPSLAVVCGKELVSPE